MVLAARRSWLERAVLIATAVSVAAGAISMVWGNADVGVLFLLATAGLVAGWALYQIPRSQVGRLTASVSPERRFELENEARKTMATIIGGLALLTGIYFTAVESREQRKRSDEERTRVADDREVVRDGQRTDMYVRAVQQLTSPSLSGRIGALLALERIARASAGDHAPIMELIASVIRERAPKNQNDANSFNMSVPEDVQVALRVIGRRNLANESRPIRFSFAGLHLKGGEFRDGSFELADFSEADLREASFEGAHLCGATFLKSDVGGASFARSDARLVDFRVEPRLPGGRWTTAAGGRLDGALLRSYRAWKDLQPSSARTAAIVFIGLPPEASQAAVAAAADIGSHGGVVLFSGKERFATPEIDAPVTKWLAQLMSETAGSDSPARARCTAEESGAVLAARNGGLSVMSQ